MTAKNLYRCNCFVIGPQGPAAASSVWNTNRAQINLLDPRDPLVPTTLFDLVFVFGSWLKSLACALIFLLFTCDVAPGIASWRLQKTLHSFQINSTKRQKSMSLSCSWLFKKKTKSKHGWWLVKLPYWFKAIFWTKILGIFQAQGEKDNFTLGEIQPHKVRLNIGKLRKPQKTGIVKFYEFLRVFRCLVQSEAKKDISC